MDVDPKQYIDELLKLAKDRGTMMLSSPSFLTDEEWRQAGAIARTKGPLTDLDKIRFIGEHDQFARSHFLDLFLELERVYSLVNWLAKEREHRQSG